MPAKVTREDYGRIRVIADDARRSFLTALEGAPAVRDAYRRWMWWERDAFEAERVRREAEIKET